MISTQSDIKIKQQYNPISLYLEWTGHVVSSTSLTLHSSSANPSSCKPKCKVIKMRFNAMKRYQNISPALIWIWCNETLCINQITSAQTQQIPVIRVRNADNHAMRQQQPCGAIFPSTSGRITLKKPQRYSFCWWTQIRTTVQKCGWCCQNGLNS